MRRKAQGDLDAPPVDGFFRAFSCLSLSYSDLIGGSLADRCLDYSGFPQLAVPAFAALAGRTQSALRSGQRWHQVLDTQGSQARSRSSITDMSQESEIIREELPEVAQIVRDECWLEAERCGHPVDPKDPVIRDRVADIILSGAGAEIRRHHTGGGESA